MTSRRCGGTVAPASFERFDLAGQVLPVAGRSRRLGDFLEQRGEVAQAGDQRRAGMVQQRDVLAGAAEQIGALDVFERYASLPSPDARRSSAAVKLPATQPRLRNRLRTRST